MSGKPAGDYGIYVGSTQDAGESATRIFWNAGTANESAASMNTRRVPGWNAKVSLLTSGPPTDGYQLIWVFKWDGSAFTESSAFQNNLFEGIMGSNDPYLYASGWGEDASTGSSLYGNRSNIRVTNGVSCWQDWAAALRTQLRDIIGDGDGTGVYGWWTGSALFTGAGGSSSWTGERSSLKHSQTHIETAADPHGTTLSQTNLDVTGTFDVAATATQARILCDDIQLSPNTSLGQIVLGNPSTLGIPTIMTSDCTITGGFVNGDYALYCRDGGTTLSTPKPKADKILSANWLFTNTLAGYEIKQTRELQLTTTNVSAGTYMTGSGKRAYFKGGGEDCDYMELKSMNTQAIYDPGYTQEGIVMNIDLNMLFS